VHERYRRQTTDRQTTDRRQTDGRRHIAIPELEFTFAKNGCYSRPDRCSRAEYSTVYCEKKHLFTCTKSIYVVIVLTGVQWK